MGVLSWLKNLGRNGWDSPLNVTASQSVESRNVYLYKAGLGTRRGGSTSVAISGLTVPVSGLIEYVPTGPAHAELWAVDGSLKIFRSATGPAFTQETLVDALSVNVTNQVSVNGATLNSKLYLAYQSGINRIHVFDPNNPTTDQVRRGGLKAFSAAPTVANTGAGSYPATLRYYRCRSIEQQSGVTTSRSEPSTSQSFTPSGSGTGALITRPTAISEHETHWEVEGSTDNITFYVVAGDAAGALSGPILIATTTYTDTSTPSTWGTTLTASAPSGTYTPFPSVKCLGTTGTRLYGFGVWETAAGDSVIPKNGRFYFSPALDTTTTQDDERISNTTTVQGWIDASRNAGTIDRGCSPKPVNNVIYCFQDKGVYAFYPTESNITPYRRVIVSGSIGNLAQQAIVNAYDHAGRQACYFCDPVLGPYTVGGYYGLAWVGKDVADIWATVNRDATTLASCGEWYPDRSQIIWFIATNGANAPNLAVALDPTKMTYDSQAGELRGGWVTYDGDWVNNLCLRLFSNTLAATRSSLRVPYSGGNKLLRYDESKIQDDTTNFKAYVQSGSLITSQLSKMIKRTYCWASANSAPVRQSLIRNTGDEPIRVADITTTPLKTESIVMKKFGDAALQDAWGVQVQLGDSVAQNSNFGTLYQWVGEEEDGGPL